MKKRILDYNNKIEKIIQNNSQETNWTDIMNDLLIQIRFFQHERLIHLIVTITFALLAIVSVLIVLVSNNIMAILLFLAILCLLIPYISHYYLLENEVQKMYTFYDTIQQKILDVKK